MYCTRSLHIHYKLLILCLKSFVYVASWWIMHRMESVSGEGLRSVMCDKKTKRFHTTHSHTHTYADIEATSCFCLRHIRCVAKQLSIKHYGAHLFSPWQFLFFYYYYISYATYEAALSFAIKFKIFNLFGTAGECFEAPSTHRLEPIVHIIRARRHRPPTTPEGRWTRPISLSPWLL